jgi:hypothetical protein
MTSSINISKSFLEMLGVEVLGEHLAQLPIVVHEQHSRLARP